MNKLACSRFRIWIILIQSSGKGHTCSFENMILNLSICLWIVEVHKLRFNEHKDQSENKRAKSMMQLLIIWLDGDIILKRGDRARHSTNLSSSSYNPISSLFLLPRSSSYLKGRRPRAPCRRGRWSSSSASRLYTPCGKCACRAGTG